MYFIWFSLPWTGKEDSLGSQQLSWLRHKQMSTPNSMLSWPGKEVLAHCEQHALLTKCCHSAAATHAMRREQFPILKNHSWISNLNINPKTKLKCITTLLQVGCLFSSCVQNCRPIMCTRQHHAHCYSSAEVGGVGDNGWQNHTKHCNRASRTAVPEKCS